MAHKLFGSDQSSKRLLHQLFARFNVLKNRPLEHEIPPVDPHIRLGGGLNLFDLPVGAERDVVAASAWPDAQESRGLVLLLKRADQIRKIKIREIVAIVGEKHFFTIQIFLDGLESLANIGVGAGIRKT